MSVMATFCGSSWNGIWQDRRDSKRYNLQLSATVYRADGRQLGVVRDVSQDGLYLYAGFTPGIGERLRLIVDGSPRAIRVTGTVLRVERDYACDSIGIAIRIDDSFMSCIEDVFLASACAGDASQSQPIFAA